MLAHQNSGRADAASPGNHSDCLATDAYVKSKFVTYIFPNASDINRVRVRAFKWLKSDTHGPIARLTPVFDPAIGDWMSRTSVEIPASASGPRISVPAAARRGLTTAAR